MDVLKRNIAPISDEAWQEIDNRAKEVLTSIISGRRVVNVNGPLGLDYTALPEGRLDVKSDQDGDIRTGTYRVKPLVEARIDFELNKWELDNIARGAKDIDLDALENAARKLAIFEENAIYNSYKEGAISGLSEMAAHTLKFGDNASEIMASISDAKFLLKNAFVDQPLTLVVGKESYKRLNAIFEGYPLLQVVESIIGGDVVLSEVVEGAILLPFDHEDIELTVGQDFSIGYEAHDSKTVKFFMTESFTFRILDEKIIVKFEV
jgi:uncharacterized linocin/CFP29 family protein